MSIQQPSRLGLGKGLAGLTAVALIQLPVAGAELSAAEQQTAAQEAIAPPEASAAPIPQPESTMAPSEIPAAPVAPIAAVPLSILSPAMDAVVDTPAVSVTLQFPVDSQVRLVVNGEAVDPTQIGRTETDHAQGVVTQTWYAVTLQAGQNTILAEGTLQGAPLPPAQVTVAVRGLATALVLETVEARIPADGRSTATVRGQLLDAEGNRSNQRAVVTLEASAGTFIGVDHNPDRSGFQVEAENGEFIATLQAGLRAEVVTLRATTTNLEAFTQIGFETALRPSLLSGSVDLRLGGRGTNYFGSFRDFLPPDGDHSPEFDGGVAVFGTGRLGDWLVTGAYNSRRPLNQDCSGTASLFRAAQACDRTYPVYGDESTSEVVTPSIDSLYLRFERTSPVEGAGSDHLMWGDYTTTDFATQSQLFTATTRQLHGLQGNYNLGNLQISGFYGTNIDGFQRDTLAPDGTSGFYFLSRRLLIAGSENVFLELEELNRPGTVLEREPLRRGLDYDIDYDRGSLLFRQPVLRTDIDDEGRTLVRRIVVTYQYESDDSANIYGGRLRYHLSRQTNRESWLGATYLQENMGDRQFELYGADALISFGSDGQLIAEYARSNHDSAFTGPVSGSAYRFEAQGTLFEGVRGRAYWRTTDPGFANNATTSFVPGQTRYGAELQAQVSPTTQLRAQYDHEDNFGTAPRPLSALEDLLNPGSEAIPGSPVNNSLTTLTAGVQQQIGDATLGVDWIHRHRQDRIEPNALSATSNQLRSRLTLPISNTLSLRAQNETTLSSTTDPLHPDRTLVGLDWLVHPGITLSFNQQFISGGQFQPQAITSLDLNGEYQFGTDTTLSSRVSLINAQALAGAIGINQGITLAPGLRANLSYEHTFGNGFGTTAAGSQFAQPFAVGQSAAGLGLAAGHNFSVGIDYTGNPDFQANAQLQHRTSSAGSNTVFKASALGRLTPSLTALANVQRASASNQGLESLGASTNLRLGLAYRDPDNDRWNALLRYEYRRNPALVPESILFGRGTGSEDHVLALEAIYAPSWQWEFYGKLALRHSTAYLADDFFSSSTVGLGQVRATHRFNYRWDVSAGARWISQPTAGYSEMALNLEAGYHLSPNLRLAGGYTFGRMSDRDFSQSRSAGGPYLGISLKLDNNLFRDFGFGNSVSPQVPDSQLETTAVEGSW
ncbi:TonB-dependent receptor [Nodosilinea sp. P-1105]|uniref:TonB-dependent receptor n=1 Tax=Nodosilinea sp. P-1105 TaxID=2546229 RepID=UPI00146D9A10|nr:TonB-dependent receptor [Nodosilinea sp. P-1105]NMF81761.1 TonB-dependent receptor [Nodosilinea sp. P-1105]